MLRSIMGHIRRREIHTAFYNLDLALIRQLIAVGVNVNGNGELAPLIIVSQAVVAHRNRPNVDEDARQAIRLLFEYGADPNYPSRLFVNDALTVFQMTVLNRFQDNDFPTNVSDIIIENVAELEARTNRQVFNERNINFINTFPELEQYYQRCQNELIAMQNNMIVETSNVTYYLILTEPVLVLSRYARNQDIIEQFWADNYQAVFPIYARRLTENFNAAIARRERIERFVNTMSLVLQMWEYSAFLVILETVFEYLSEEDVNRIIGN